MVHHIHWFVCLCGSIYWISFVHGVYICGVCIALSWHIGTEDIQIKGKQQKGEWQTMNEEESTKSKDEDKQCRMEDKINSINARTIGVRDDINGIEKVVVMNRTIMIIIWSMSMVIIWFWLSRAV